PRPARRRSPVRRKLGNRNAKLGNAPDPERGARAIASRCKERKRSGRTPEAASREAGEGEPFNEHHQEPEPAGSRAGEPGGRRSELRQQRHGVDVGDPGGGQRRPGGDHRSGHRGTHRGRGGHAGLADRRDRGRGRAGHGDCGGAGRTGPHGPSPAGPPAHRGEPVADGPGKGELTCPGSWISTPISSCRPKPSRISPTTLATSGRTSSASARSSCTTTPTARCTACSTARTRTRSASTTPRSGWTAGPSTGWTASPEGLTRTTCARGRETAPRAHGRTRLFRARMSVPRGRIRPAMFHADLHIHSKFSRACSKDCDIEHLSWWALRKGLRVLGTGDFTHPAWAAELKETLVPAEPGLFRIRPDLEKRLFRDTPASCAGTVRFMLSVEISTIYRRDDRTRKVHHLLYAPGFDEADRITAALARIGNLASDGRPILGLDSRDLLDITLSAGPGCFLVPAHVWTPWFAVL